MKQTKLKRAEAEIKKVVDGKGDESDQTRVVFKVF